MILFLFAFLAGVATTLSPCILPILPALLSGAVGGRARPYGIILGFVASFTFFALSLSWLLTQFGWSVTLLRGLAAVTLIIMGLVLALPPLSRRFALWSGALSGRLQGRLKRPESAGFGGGFLTGLPLGLIWAPCTGPIMTAVLSVALAGQVTTMAVAVAFAYSAGVGAVMLPIILLGRRALQSIKMASRYTTLLHHLFGLLIIATGAAILFGADILLQRYIVERIPLSWIEFWQRFEYLQPVQEGIGRL